MSGKCFSLVVLLCVFGFSMCADKQRQSTKKQLADDEVAQKSTEKGKSLPKDDRESSKTSAESRPSPSKIKQEPSSPNSNATNLHPVVKPMDGNGTSKKLPLNFSKSVTEPSKNIPLLMQNNSLPKPSLNLNPRHLNSNDTKPEGDKPSNNQQNSQNVTKSKDEETKKNVNAPFLNKVATHQDGVPSKNLTQISSNKQQIAKSVHDTSQKPNPLFLPQVTTPGSVDSSSKNHQRYLDKNTVPMKEKPSMMLNKVPNNDEDGPFELVDREVKSITGSEFDNDEDFIDAADLLLENGDHPFSIVEDYAKNDNQEKGFNLDIRPNVAIVPVPTEYEQWHFPSLPNPRTAFVPDMITVIPFNLKELDEFEVKLPTISAVSPGSYKIDIDHITQEEVEPDFTKSSLPKRAPKRYDSANDDKQLDLNEDRIVLEIPGFAGGNPFQFKYLWPKFLGPAPNIGLPIKAKSKGKNPGNPPSHIYLNSNATAKPLPLLAVGKKCRNSRQCLSGCCLRREEKGSHRCDKKVLKGERCSTSQTKVGVYHGICPCAAGDAQCLPFKEIATCGA